MYVPVCARDCYWSSTRAKHRSKKSLEELWGEGQGGEGGEGRSKSIKNCGCSNKAIGISSTSRSEVVIHHFVAGFAPTLNI